MSFYCNDQTSAINLLFDNNLQNRDQQLSFKQIVEQKLRKYFNCVNTNQFDDYRFDDVLDIQIIEQCDNKDKYFNMIKLQHSKILDYQKINDIEMYNVNKLFDDSIYKSLQLFEQFINYVNDNSIEYTEYDQMRINFINKDLIQSKLFMSTNIEQILDTDLDQITERQLQFVHNGIISGAITLIPELTINFLERTIEKSYKLLPKYYNNNPNLFKKIYSGLMRKLPNGTHILSLYNYFILCDDNLIVRNNSEVYTKKYNDLVHCVNTFDKLDLIWFTNALLDIADNEFYLLN